MYVRLILDSGKQKGRDVILARGTYLVGRSRVCQIRPKNRYVSRKHCAIIHRKREVLIQDLGSKTGTFINRVRIAPNVATTLNDGDKIRVGKTKFLVTIAPQDAPAQDAQQSSDGGDKEVKELELAPDESLVPQKSSYPENDAAQGKQHDIVDVLRLLEEKREEGDADSRSYIGPGSAFRLSSKENDIDLDDDDDSDGNVVFAAPKSSESLGFGESLPSYASRKDWDVKSVYSWIEQKETFARLDERRAKRKAKALLQSAAEVNVESAATMEEEYTHHQREAQSRVAASKATVLSQRATWIEWLDSDSARPLVLIGVGVAFFAWLAWNAWQLVSFKG